MDKVQLKNKLHKLKLALTLSGILGGNALSANAVENNKTTDTSRTQYKTEVITKHINNQYTQKYIESGKQTTAFTKHGVTKDYHAASQILFDLGDGYFMISSKVVRQHTSPEKIKKQHNDVLYLAAPDGKTYDCSFLYDEKDGSYLPLGFEKDFFVKENGEADKQLTDKVVKDVQKTVGVDFISPEITQKYNDIVTQKKLRRAENMDFPGDIVDKIGIYLKQNQEEIETGKIFISSIYNEVKDSSRNLTQQIIKKKQRQH